MGEVFRDQNLGTALLFYLPTPLVAAWVGLSGAWMVLHARRGTAFALIALSYVAWTWVGFVENRPGPEPLPPTGDAPVYRAAHWNILSGKRGWTRAIAWLRQAEADIYLISETARGREPRFLVKDFGPEHYVLKFERQAVVSPYPLSDLEPIVDTPSLQLWQFEWHLPERDLKVFMVDIGSDLMLVRDPLLRTINEHVEEKRPDLVIGDFNAPRRSLALSDLPRGYAHAYDAVGHGPSYTWPMPVPVLAIDHCLFHRALVPVAYELYGSKYSDHRLQVFDFRMAD